MKTVIGVLVAACLTGCASMNQAVSSYLTAGQVGAQGVNDNYIQAWKDAACSTPVGAVIRHPEIIPGIKALCIPGGSASDPSTLLPSK